MRAVAAILLAVCASVYCQDFAYPESPGQRLDAKPIDKNQRVPLYAPDKCKDPNQLWYPGNQDTDWICDCGPTFIYYPPKDACFAAFRKGPCPEGQHLILKRAKVVPECVTNPCDDGFARYKGKCYEMDKPNGPCPSIQSGGGIFGVNATTLVVECLKGTDPLSLINIPGNCPPGSKRQSNVCRENWNA